jgi:hypothetical protein
MTEPLGKFTKGDTGAGERTSDLTKSTTEQEEGLMT